MSAMKNIVAKADVVETFPKEVAIYDLNEFLSSLSLFTQPVLDFQDQYMTMKDEGSKATLKYWYSDPSVVTSPSKMITMPSEDVKLTLSSEDIEKLKRAASVVQAPDMVLEKTDNGCALTVCDKKNNTANNYAIDVDCSSNAKSFKFFFKVENMKLLPGTYDITISSKNISNFKNSAKNIEYWIALEPESTYEA
tara:strand:+ start:180 stop:761 length:582 start_codon:yes stop_codon:yes gene_type:complete